MVRVFDGLAQFSRFLSNAAIVASAVPQQTVGDVARIAYNRALSLYGDNTKLRSLTPATQQERVLLGYTPNDPLHRSGHLKSELEFEHRGMEAGYGSADPVQLFHEVGYMNHRTGKMVEPRPLLRISAQETVPDGWELVKAAAVTMVDGKV